MQNYNDNPQINLDGLLKYRHGEADYRELCGLALAINAQVAMSCEKSK